MPTPFTSKVIKRIDVPGDPGEWIEVRMPSIEIIAEIRGAEDLWSTILACQRCIVRWSYTDPITPEAIADLNQETAAAVIQALWEPEPPEAAKNA